MRLLELWFNKRNKKVDQERAIHRLMDISREMRRIKLDHYGNWTTDPQYVKLSGEFDKLSEQVKEANGSR